MPEKSYFNTEKETAEREGKIQFEMKLHQLKAQAVSIQKNEKR